MRLLASTRLVLSCALALVTACSGDDGNAPVIPDATVPDAGPDVPPDARNDGGPELPPDARNDGGPEVPPDAGPDVPPDARNDGGPEVPPDGGPEIPPDAAPEVPPDAAPEVPAPAFVLSTAELVVGEGDATGATPAMHLSEAPGRTVAVTVASGDPAAVAVSPATLSFDDGSYEIDQMVQIAAVDDADTVDEAVTITLSAAGLADATVAVSAADDDTQTIVASTAAVSVGEAGTTTLTVRLSHDPSAPLQLAVTSSDAGAVSVSPALLSFDSGNFAEPQTITVSGVADSDVLDESARVTVSGAGVADADVSVGVDDDDTLTIVASATSLAVDEGGSATFTVRLSNDPSGPLQVAVASSDATAASVSPAALRFDSGNFAEPQVVTVTGVIDDDIDSETVTVNLLGAGLVIPVAVGVTDTTQPPFSVDMFVRGSFNGFELDDELVFQGGVHYSALVSLHSAIHELKIADAAFSFERTFSVSQDFPGFISVDTPTPLVRAAGVFNNTQLAITSPGIYRFDLEVNDLAAPVLTVSLEEPATYFRDMYVRGSWGSFEAIDRMTYQGSGRHTALVPLDQGVHEFKISDAAFLNDATFSVSAAGLTPIELDTPTPLELAVGEFNNTSLTIPRSGVYLFDMDASDPAAPILTITLVETAPFAASMFVRAGFNGFGLANELRYDGGGRYSAVVTLSQATHAFKIADAAFSAGTTFSVDAATPVVIDVGVPVPLQPVREQDSNTLVTILQAGIYRFELDARDSASPVLAVVLVEAAPLATDLYVRGSFNAFGLGDPLVFQRIILYETRIELGAGTHAFKIADESFSPDTTFSAGVTEPVAIELGVPATFSVAPGESNDTRLTIEQPGVYLFQVEVISPTLLIVTVSPDVVVEQMSVSGVSDAGWLAAWLAAVQGVAPAR